jgi:hypothetical protein
MEAGAARVLVAGAGCGREYAYLHEFEPCGFDISATMVAECHRRFPEIRTVVCTSPERPCAPSSWPGTTQLVPEVA